MSKDVPREMETTSVSAGNLSMTTISTTTVSAESTTPISWTQKVNLNELMKSAYYQFTVISLKNGILLSETLFP